MTRWIALLLLLLAAAPAVCDCHACMTEPEIWVTGDLRQTEERFKIYRDAGVDMLRVQADWRVVEPWEGVWDMGGRIEYIRLARKYGFRIKLILGVIMAPPVWFREQHPDSRAADENGVFSANTLSYCYPGLKKVISEKTDKIISILREAGVWDDVECVIPAFGPAGEPIYPHPWTMEPDYGEPRFWNYEEWGQKAWRAAMKKKYRTIARANAAWGTEFAGFDSMPLLSSGEKPGAYWNDYLTWMRDVKRDYVRWELRDIRRAAKGKKVLVYIPGTAYSEKDWQEAVETGAGSWTVKMMCDSMWVMEEALRQGAWLQYTGCEDGDEVARLRNYLDSHGHRDAVMWGENAGYWRAAKDPLHLADVCVKNRLCGLDYTFAHFAFALEGAETMPEVEDLSALADPNIRIKPHPVIMPELRAAFGIVRDYNRQMAALRK